MFKRFWPTWFVTVLLRSKASNRLISVIDVLLKYVQGMYDSEQTNFKLLPFISESSWATGRWDIMEKYINMTPQSAAEDFNVSIARTLLALHKKKPYQFRSNIQKIREQISRSLSMATTSSLSACHDTMLKLHVLTELEIIAGIDNESPDLVGILGTLSDRIEVLGAYLNDKQYVLGIRRAAMHLSRFVIKFNNFSDDHFD